MKKGDQFLLLIVAGVLAYHLGLFDLISGKETALHQNDKVVMNDSTSSNNKLLPDSVVQNGLTYGIDISHWKGVQANNFNDSLDSVRFIIAKATEGISIQDSEFDNNRTASLNDGFIFGSFHFFQSNLSVQPQIDNYLSVVGEFPSDQFPPIIDIESSNNPSITGIHPAQSKQQVSDSLLLMLQLLQKQTGRTPIVYVRVNDVTDYISGDAFASYPLWICDYTSAESPQMPGPWAGQSWTFWQRTDKYAHDSDTLDLDVFNGDEKALKQFIKKY